jgi:hypothetical protein
MSSSKFLNELDMNSYTLRYELVRFGDMIHKSIESSVEVCLYDKLCLTSPRLSEQNLVAIADIFEFSKS